MKKTYLSFSLFILLFLLALLLVGCGEAPTPDAFSSRGEQWYIGFAAEEITLPENPETPLYMAGYMNGVEYAEVGDLQRASAVWLGTNENEGILLIGVDCIGLASDTVDEIRARLQDFCDAVGCASVAVYATHTHAGIDTLGLWGPYAQEGKNAEFLENVIASSVTAAQNAYANRKAGKMFIGQNVAENMQYDSRQPEVYDENLYQLRFVPDDGGSGVRMVWFGAHAESLRGANLILSRDFPGVMSDIIKEQSGDDMLFLPGAIGGLIMTPVIIERDAYSELDDAQFHLENCRTTGEILARMVLLIQPHTEREVAPILSYAETSFDVPLDNTAFLMMKFLGILRNKSGRGSDSATGYYLTSRCAAIRFGEDITAALIPGEIFPELVYWDTDFPIAASDGTLTEDTFPSLSRLAAQYDCGTLLIAGLCNDELGYILPADAFLVHPTLPYFERIVDDTGENHYEETNSAGIRTAQILFAAMEDVFAALAKQK